MALRAYFEQTKIGCPGVAEFTVQRTEALFDHITGFRQIIGYVWFALPSVDGCGGLCA